MWLALRKTATTQVFCSGSKRWLQGVENFLPSRKALSCVYGRLSRYAAEKFGCQLINLFRPCAALLLLTQRLTGQDLTHDHFGGRIVSVGSGGVVSFLREAAFVYLALQIHETIFGRSRSYQQLTEKRELANAPSGTETGSTSCITKDGNATNRLSLGSTNNG